MLLARTELSKIIFAQKEKSENSEIIMESIARIVNKVSLLMKKPRMYDTGDILYTSEIHMIEVIGKNPGINVTEIAYCLGITKGAIPKIIRKLLQKSLIRRYQEKNNKKTVLFQLTDKGIICYKNHIQFHEKIDHGIRDKLNTLTYRDLYVLNDILHELEKHADYAHTTSVEGSNI